jgi:hypothetical protein
VGLKRLVGRLVSGLVGGLVNGVFGRIFVLCRVLGFSVIRR